MHGDAKGGHLPAFGALLLRTHDHGSGGGYGGFAPGGESARLLYPPVKVFYFSRTNYEAGVERVHTETGNFRIYGEEKTIVDCFRYRYRLGEDVAVEGLKNYLARKDADLNRLFSYAREGRMYRVIKPYVEALMA